MRYVPAINALARIFYRFLPGSGARAWSNHVTFGTVAASVGVGEYWAGGSKEPAIVALLSGVFERRRDRFEPLILAIVREGIRYCAKGKPVTRAEIEQVNGHLRELEFKFPSLWDENFLRSLDASDRDRARAHVEAARAQAETRATESLQRRRVCDELARDLQVLAGLPDRAAAGLSFEKLLNRLFTAFALSPREAFRVRGEQIDGSFEFQMETYLLEAKWIGERVGERDLAFFRAKVEGKSAFTRGLFVALNGVTADALHAIRIGKQPNFFILDGTDLMAVLMHQIALDELLERRKRLLAEEGCMYLPFPELLRRK